MKVLKSIGIAVAVVSGGVFSQGALAACSYIGGQDDITVSSPAVTIDPDLPINSVLGTITMRSSATTMANCNPPGMNLNLTTGYERGAGDFYLIGIAGVSMRITLGEDRNGHYASSNVNVPLLTDQSPDNQLYSWQPEITLQLVKTGNITSGGSIRSDKRLVRASGVNTSGSFTFFDAYLATPLEIKVLQPTCSAASTNPNVSLDSISTSDFDPSGRAKSTDFNIDLSCTGGGTTDVSVTLTDANRAGNTGATLTAAAGSDAEGIALEVHKGSGSSSPVQFGSKWLAIPGAGVGSHSIPLSVNYLKTGPLKSGEVKAGMTYTLDYE